MSRSGGSRRMSLLDKMEHIAELEGLVDDDDSNDSNEEEEDDELDDSVLKPGTGITSVPESFVSTLDEVENAEDDDDDDDEEGDGEDEDEDDDVIFTATELGYEWQGGLDLGYGDEEEFGYGDLGYEDQSQITNGSSANGSTSDLEALASPSTTAALRRVSSLRASRTGNSYSSAPETGRDDEMLGIAEGGGGAQRRSTFAGPPGGRDGLSRRVSSRRQHINLGSVAAPPGMNSFNMSSMTDSNQTGAGGHGSGSVLQKMKSRTFGSHARRATAMKSRRSVGGELNSIQQAASKLESSGPDSVFAAASVVAHSAATAAKRGHIQFNTDDAVLCMLTLLNVTNSGDDTESFTVSPVNIYGYPPGEGKTEAERQAPYVFVLVIVKFVHFDEDERYYTVVRADNGTEQRADTGWMEPLRNQAGVEAARKAAARTGRAMKEQADDVKDADGCGQTALNIALAIFALPLRFAMKLIPWYKLTRAHAKIQVTHLLYGDSSYACRFRLTGINVLVLCSFIFLFFENVKLAFFPAALDHAMSVIGFIVWCILGLELLFEYLIRPSTYPDLIESDQAYAPSTARHINLYHLVFESMALLLFIPELDCLFSADSCGQSVPFSGIWASIHAVDGSDSSRAALGRLCLGLTSLRLFGLVRHWKQMWINNTFADDNKNSNLVRRFLLLEYEGKEKDPWKDDGNSDRPDGGSPTQASSEEDQRLKNAATIGTALMVVNSHRALIVLVFIVTVLPMIISYQSQNMINDELTDILHGNNRAAPFEDDCEYMKDFVQSWLLTAESIQPDSKLLNTNTYLLWARILPYRCPEIQRPNGVITLCNGSSATMQMEPCQLWEETAREYNNVTADLDNLTDYFANELDIRVGGINQVTRCAQNQTNPDACDFQTQVIFNDNFTVAFTNMGLFILLATLLIMTIFGLTVMRNDAGRLVLDPLRRMLKIVVRYAENPLMETGDLKGKPKSDGDGDGDEKGQLGNYETEQLINAIAKIADLLRKCWGVAGAGIISTNLARTKEGKTVVFNPTVPGKRVYALFGFVAINGFDKQLHALGRDVMILINDVAKVVHDEVFRWALGDSGQCNRNLGAAFLMVFRIGDFNEIHNKKKLAQDVVFNTNGNSNRKSTNALRKRKASKGKKRTSHRNIDMGADGTLQLASLPGIQSFTDRALLGMLKSYAGIHRDKRLLNWKKDWRLGAGVGAFTVNVIYGMDAGWAVEGAVGSEYKIDATYLSPHVNMASRMMSATKQYSVTILLSQAVEELLSRPARSTLRHLDTVFVKGSSVAQRIFTFDARHEGVDFFLFERSPEKADRDADAYTDKIWETDQDLCSMRQHVKEEFAERFKEGVDQYLDGKWKEAIETLSAADDMMIQTVIEEGYIDFDPEEYGAAIFDRSIRDDDIVRIRTEYGDGASKCLINYMERRNGVPPKDWMGVRKLDSK